MPPMRARPFLIAGAAAALVVCGASLHRAFAGHAPASAPRSPHHVYHLDYAVAVSEGGKPADTTHLAMSLEDGSGGDMHAGANVPLQVSGGGMASPRQDVGLHLKTNVTSLGRDVLLHVVFEISGADNATEGPRSIRKVSTSGDALVTPGKPTVVAVIEEPATHARYEVSVVASKLR